MKGSVSLRTDKKHPYWRVCWPVAGNRSVKISHYLGESEPMYQGHPDNKKDIGFHKAHKLLAMMQADEERGILRLEKYTGEHCEEEGDPGRKGCEYQ